MHHLVLFVEVSRVGVVRGDVHGADVVQHVVGQLLQSLWSSGLLFKEREESKLQRSFIPTRSWAL